MRRVVITGIGIVSSIGNNATEVEASLRAGKSGIVFAPEYAERGFRSQVHGQPNIVLEDNIDKRDLRFMGDGAAYNFIAMRQAIEDSGLEAGDISNDRTGIIVGSGGPSTKSFFKAHNIVRETGSPKRIGPFGVTKGMSSTTSACLATPFKIRGVNYSITSACSTSAHCIGNGAELIQMGKQDIVFAGGGEELDWTLSCLFDAMGAMSSKYNDAPETASRTYDATRDGFVIAGGGGVVVLEELSHALARGAKIYGEVTGYKVWNLTDAPTVAFKNQNFNSSVYSFCKSTVFNIEVQTNACVESLEITVVGPRSYKIHRSEAHQPFTVFSSSVDDNTDPANGKVVLVGRSMYYTGIFNVTVVPDGSSDRTKKFSFAVLDC